MERTAVLTVFVRYISPIKNCRELCVANQLMMMMHCYLLAVILFHVAVAMSAPPTPEKEPR